MRLTNDASLLPRRIKVTEPKPKPRSATVDFWNEWSKDINDIDIELEIEALRKQSK